MQVALFVVSAVVVYVVTAWAIKRLERRRGATLPNRQIIFFIVFFALILVTFELLKLILAS